MEQPYLLVLYEAIFCLAYYGLMRIGELTEGDHPIKAKDIHIGVNKDKILLVLYTSKTHSIKYVSSADQDCINQKIPVKIAE